MTKTLDVSEASVHFGALRAVDHVSFDVGAGEIVALIGPNGAGKTALLNAICGIYPLAHGRIMFEGEDLAGRHPHEIAERGIGRSFQHAELFDGLSVVENLLVAACGRLPGSSIVAGLWFGRYRRREEQAREMVEEAIDFFELERYRHVDAHDLSFGVQKLVGVARALCGNPRMLLLDEPSSGLTRQEKEDFARFLLRLRYDWEIPILWIEHDMQLVMDLSDRIVALDYGRTIAEGSADEIANDPDVAAAYLGVSVEELTGGQDPS